MNAQRKPRTKKQWVYVDCPADQWVTEHPDGTVEQAGVTYPDEEAHRAQRLEAKH